MTSASEHDQNPRLQDLAAIATEEHLHHFLNIANDQSFSEDDKWSEDPERRRLYLLYDAARDVQRHIRNVSESLLKLPDNCGAALQTGHVLGGRNITFYFSSVPLDMTPTYREQVSTLVAEIKDIMHEKGFRYPNALLTPREHQEIGSSGYGGIYFETDPDVPVPILHGRLIAEGKIDSEEGKNASYVYTVEETDRARRLMGETVLDLETGRVTDQVDEQAVSDSYIYLSPERKAEIKKREAEILAEIEAIATGAIEEQAKSVNILSSLDAYSKGELPLPELLKVWQEVIARLGDRDNLNLNNHINELRKIAFATGKWDRILTPQEILLRVGSHVDERYLFKPYTPLAIQEGEPIEEIVLLRNGEKSMVVSTDLLEYEMPFGFRLEGLNKDGSTIKSPTFLDREYGEEDREEETKLIFKDRACNFPFARPEDWYYKGVEN